MRFRNSVITAAAAVMLFAPGANAATVNVTFVNVGPVGSSTLFRADLTGLGLAQIGSLKITDGGSGTGGSPGIFSGFDLDAVFLDVDGDVSTAGDQSFGTSFAFTAGTTRDDLGIAAFQPNLAHPGPTFGSFDSTTIDFGTATLNVFDGVSVADVNVADGFLTLGDGGMLTVDFVPSVAVGLTLFLAVGEVGTGQGEFVNGSVEVSDVPQIPVPAAAWLFATALLGLGGVGYNRRRKTNAKAA